MRNALGAARSLRMLRVAAMAAAAAVAVAAAQDPDAADEALKMGDLAEARTLLGQTVKGSPADYNALLAYASTLPPKEALKIADTLSRAANAPGWAKARGLRISGDHLFLREEYKKAADAYLQAASLDSAPAYKHLYALSIALDGRAEAARLIWSGLSADKSNELSGEAARLLALLPKPAAPETPVAPVNQQPAASVNQQNNAPINKPDNPPASTAAAVKADTVKTPPPAPVSQQPAAPVNQQNNAPINKPDNPPASTAAAAVKADTVKTPPPPAPKPAGPAFTIQVGAFASKENADNLVRRLVGKYEDITVSTTGSGDQTLYRVRVGTFQKKEDAVAYADKLIIEAGLSARVTEK